MELKKIIIILSITTIVAIGILFGTSYAWYAYSNAETSFVGKTKETTPTVIFSQTEYIYSKITMPINDDDRYNYASKNSFTITIDENLKDYDVGLEVSLREVSMSNELKTESYRYELLQDGVAVASGNFSKIGSADTLSIMPMTKMAPTTYPTTYNYELYIWLSEDGSNQNALMNKVFSAKVNINSAVKK